MGMNPGTFLKRAESITTGFGYKKEIPGLGINQLRLATGGILVVDSGNPGRVSLETSFEGVQLPSSQTALGSLTFKIPRDYDQTQDELAIRLLANSAGDTNTPTIDASLYRKREGVALTADLDPTISGATNTNTALADWVEVNCDALSLQPGDAVTVQLTTSAHNSDALNVYAIEVIYRSDLVFNVQTDR